MKTYRVERGPVWPPASLYGERAALTTGETLRSDENSWTRKAVADGRLREVEATEAPGATEPRRKQRKGGTDA